MSKFKDRHEVKNSMEDEGLAYFLQGYTSADAMPDAELERAFEKARAALNEFEAMVNAKPIAYECSSVERQLVDKFREACREDGLIFAASKVERNEDPKFVDISVTTRPELAFKVWTSDDKWADIDVQRLADQLDMRQRQIQTELPSIIKYKKMVDDAILMRVDKVIRLPRNWHENTCSVKDGMTAPMYKADAGDMGPVKRIMSVKYLFDIDELRMPENRGKFPAPEALGESLANELRCRPDKKGFHWLSNVECCIKQDAYMVEMIVYLYAVDFGGGING